MMNCSDKNDDLHTENDGFHETEEGTCSSSSQYETEGSSEYETETETETE